MTRRRRGTGRTRQGWTLSARAAWWPVGWDEMSKRRGVTGYRLIRLHRSIWDEPPVGAGWGSVPLVRGCVDVDVVH